MNQEEEAKIVRSLVEHPGWKLLDPFLEEQASAERLVNVKDWEEYRNINKEIELARGFRAKVIEYLNNE